MVAAYLLAAHLAAQSTVAAPTPRAYVAGIELLGRGQVQRAVSKLLTCRRNPACALGLAIAYTKQGKNQKALLWYERYLATTPDTDEADRVRKAMCALRGDACAEGTDPPTIGRARLAQR